MRASDFIYRGLYTKESTPELRAAASKRQSEKMMGNQIGRGKTLANGRKVGSGMWAKGSEGAGGKFEAILGGPRGKSRYM